MANRDEKQKLLELADVLTHLATVLRKTIEAMTPEERGELLARINKQKNLRVFFMERLI
jgi:hypothetical protein